MSRLDLQSSHVEINKILVRFIEEYIIIGKKYPCVLTEASTKRLFPVFEKCIREIKESNFKSDKPINVERQIKTVSERCSKDAIYSGD